ncbi:Spo0E family sporulation regulatory protein-aspartic acid phosphatase [Sporosarcina sp. P2]|uniref:aspartyl-phosphate phosphatase Spo0E family protein n=1 Tax=Sporosarcina sp. P2 TaxID=2048251 RepID=UPI000C167202|nr:aspartyl-phosphate phosphatase Spo0E family protein [Sporosarcina sp. P2]PID03626.1 Spo0E family sporulation regulatory protein-aspartic acid phosphatase [Sporosarcina sp. P2]
MISFWLKKILKLRIELKRKDMYKKAKNLGFTHPLVVKCSQELDVLLNNYLDQSVK